MNPLVRIMMATYNGEKFIQQQIDSIISQTYKKWNLIIQDDGSKDGTWRIIEEYANNDARITIRKSPEEKHGAYYNFHSIANQEKQNGSSFDYYMFCDQDDVWDDDKIERMLHAFINTDESIPKLIYGDMRVMNAEEQVVIGSVVREQGLFYKNAASLFFSHIIYGCNLMMNKAAFYSVPVIDTNADIVSILSHDNLYAKFAGVRGRVQYLDVPLMTYRRHGGNVTAKHQYGFGIKRILKRMSKLDDLAKDHARTYKQSLYAIKLLQEIGGKGSVNLTEIYNCIRSSGLKAVKLYCNNKIDCGNRVKNVSRCVVLFTGMQKKYLFD